MIPTRGVSSIDSEGKPFHDADADAALFTALKANLASNVRLVEMDTDINDEAFAVKTAELLIGSLQGGQIGAPAPCPRRYSTIPVLSRSTHAHDHGPLWIKQGDLQIPSGDRRSQSLVEQVRHDAQRANRDATLERPS